mmetsp:Transcript_3482/g.6649  ORF Transcript_3482/g.6649 Transcript_3482/m.6649 type:complete len:295 (+) Transcript_3482:147-1031(+)|eukprot:scaffold41945_cov199-Amphora_coffeaeformis.AAC.3
MDNNECTNEETRLLRQGSNQTSNDTTRRLSSATRRRTHLIILALLLIAILGVIIHLSTPDLMSSPLILSSATISIPRLGASHHKIRTITFPETCSSHREMVILLIRHCEDGSTTRHSDSSRHCNALGFERANYFATLFANRWPLPSRLYGLIKGKNMRQYETLAPLSNRIGLPIQMFDYPGIDATVIAHEENLRNVCEDGGVTSDNHRLPPMVTVVAWKHADIPILARQLGCDHCPDEWSDDDFDSVWELHYHWDGENEPAEARPSWQVYYTVVYQHFDALTYEYQLNVDTEGA